MLTLANIFQPLIDIFEPALTFFHNHLALSWGLSIVALTVVIRALMLPLAFKQFHSMQKLQQAAPELKAIQAKYKDDKQRQQQEVMKFYRENEINPFASCLPLAAQIPVFIGLFYTLRTRLRKDICPTVQTNYEQRYALAHHISAKAAAGQTVACGSGHGASFLFINDITSTATGLTLVILIVLYVGTQLASTLMMSTPAMEPNQRRIMMLMPLFFVVFIIRFPAGLILYWITTNAWTMGQQYVIRRRIGPVTPVPAAAPGSARPPTDGKARPPATTNGDGSNGQGEGGSGGLSGLSGLLKGRPKDESKEPTGVAAAARPRRDTPPPKPPRKKKKRSGRRR
ncbi:MAG TPA: YidC/Oxa1 family membrane protein insertase [Solirubrobacteraceae bacterium]|nr:YidC/Oxa1 family membrane protein insertase [Solirubrobacteraceae bacterium]